MIISIDMPHLKNPPQSPKVTLSCDKSLQALQRGQFDLETNKWVLSLGDGTDSCSHMTVTGIPVVLNGCIVADLVSPTFRKRYLHYELIFKIFMKWLNWESLQQGFTQ